MVPADALKIAEVIMDKVTGSRGLLFGSRNGLVWSSPSCDDDDGACGSKEWTFMNIYKIKQITTDNYSIAPTQEIILIIAQFGC